jgi:hypothetical protein
MSDRMQIKPVGPTANGLETGLRRAPPKSTPKTRCAPSLPAADYPSAAVHMTGLGKHEDWTREACAARLRSLNENSTKQVLALIQAHDMQVMRK